MRVFEIEATEDTPGIILNKEKNIFEISGKSIPEDVMFFFKPVIDWINEYAKDPLEETVFSFKMEYYNTASSRFLLDIMLALEDIQKDGHKVFVKWFYPHNDGDIEEGGRDYFDMVKLPHEIIPFTVQINQPVVEEPESIPQQPEPDIQEEVEEEKQETAETVNSGSNSYFRSLFRRFFSSKNPE